jgi:hypothetical protein
MGRKPIGEAAMTAAARQRRRRKKLATGGKKPDAAYQARIAELETRIEELEAEFADVGREVSRGGLQGRGAEGRAPTRKRKQSGHK